MIEIISKQDGPRREDVAMKRLLQENRGTIGQLKKALTGGGVSAPVIAVPTPEAVRSFGYRRLGRAPGGVAYLRFSRNGRVVTVDTDTGRQVHHLGDLRGAGAGRRFVLATADNGYFAPLDPAVAEALAGLDRLAVADDEAETALKGEIASRLGLDP